MRVGLECTLSPSLSHYGVDPSLFWFKTIKIVWGGFDDEFVWVITVDTVTFQVCEIRTEPHSKWFDPKIQGAGFKYKFAVATNDLP